MDCIVRGVAESQIRLSDFHFHSQDYPFLEKKTHLIYILMGGSVIAGSRPVLGIY